MPRRRVSLGILVSALQVALGFRHRSLATHQSAHLVDTNEKRQHPARNEFQSGEIRPKERGCRYSRILAPEQIGRTRYTPILKLAEDTKRAPTSALKKEKSF